MKIPSRLLTPNRIIEPSREKSLRVVDAPDYLKYVGQAMITLSYDDGFVNHYKLVLPLHQKYNIPGTFNVITSRFRSSKRCSVHQMREMQAFGMEIASHSHYHTEEFPNLTDEEIIYECVRSRSEITDALGVVPESFAIPFSQYDDRVRGIVSQYYHSVRGYGSKANSIPPEDRFWLKSILAVKITTTFDEVKTLIDAAVANKTWIFLMFHNITPTPTTLDESSPELLEQILAYIKGFGKDILLPITQKDGIKFSTGVFDYVTPL